MIYAIHHYPADSSYYDEPSWIDLEVETALANDLEAFCQRNLIPFKKHPSTPDKNIYQIREGMDYDDVLSFLLLQSPSPYKADVINEINALAFSRMYHIPTYAYEEHLQRSETDSYLLSQFV